MSARLQTTANLLAASTESPQYYALDVQGEVPMNGRSNKKAIIAVATAACIGILVYGTVWNKNSATLAALSPVQTQRVTRAAAAMAGTAALAVGQPAFADVAPPQVQQVTEAPATAQFADSRSAPALVDEYQLPEGAEWRYSDFINAVKRNQVERVRFAKDGSTLQLTAINGARASVILPNDPDLVDTLAKNGVDISVSEGTADSGGPFAALSSLLFPGLLLLGLFAILRRGSGDAGGAGGMGGMAGGPMDFGKSKSKFQEVPETGVRFEDVAGVEGAKLELQEVVDFLKSPEKYTKLGAKIPKGCLLAGPPGTGKTLLAKAVAGEAGVPFFSASASEFVELFVGVGASRVRDLFEKAKAKAPCIVFIDELDAVGRQRGAGMGGGNDEREQTINQLLTEMDGFEGNTGVIVLAATNRPDVLDSALLRPGRFDRQVTVDRPDVAGRVKILGVHSRDKVLAPDVDLEVIARRTPGFTGADLQNVMNEAAILTARRGKTQISNDEVADALEKIVAGPEKAGAVMTDVKRKLVAYHEAGHALVGALMPEYDDVAKISIVPRGAAGGLTFFAPDEQRLESGLYSRSYLENQMAVALGGRIAEELIFGEDEITTGASNDFQQVTRTARMMVTQMGFSKKVGQVALAGSSGPAFLGQSMGQTQSMSQETMNVVDAEVKDLVERAYRRAKDLMVVNMDALHNLADALIEKETIDGDEAREIIVATGAKPYIKNDAPGVTIPYQAA
jgi:cell division protease FtsH|mmetsp:Transcript_41247/g.69395  ORF Transcript_41247/g.69395 Transcript_41247/m.69395 type:complete len:737 (-) Transcript_41247:867-3077(-)